MIRDRGDRARERSGLVLAWGGRRLLVLLLIDSSLCLNTMRRVPLDFGIRPSTTCFAANDGENGGPKMCGSADNSDAAKGLVVDAVVAVVAAVSIYAVALF